MLSRALRHAPRHRHRDSSSKHVRIVTLSSSPNDILDFPSLFSPPRVDRIASQSYSTISTMSPIDPRSHIHRLFHSLDLPTDHNLSDRDTQHTVTPSLLVVDPSGFYAVEGVARLIQDTVFCAAQVAPGDPVRELAHASRGLA